MSTLGRVLLAVAEDRLAASSGDQPIGSFDPDGRNAFELFTHISART